MVECSYTSEIKCSRYFYIKEHDKWVKLEEFMRKFKGNSGKTLLTHEVLEKNTYLYRENEYEYRELFNQEVLNLNLGRFYKEFSPKIKISQKNCCLARLIETLDRYINKARYELIKSSNIIDIDYFNCNISEYQYEWYYFQRCFNAENAIYSYYSTFEILMQIIWVYKEFYKDNNLSEILETYRLKKLIDNLKKKEDPIFLKEFCSKEGWLYPKFEEVRNWCNNFKHKGLYRFDGEEIFDINFSYEYLDMDKEVIPKLINYHNEVLKLSNYIISNIEF